MFNMAQIHDGDLIISKICRICETSDDLSSIFDEEKLFSICIFKAIMALAQVEISQNDGLPPMICSVCMVQMRNAYLFKLQCEASDMKFRKQSNIRSFTKTEKLIEIEVKPPDIKIESDELYVMLLGRKDEDDVSVKSEDRIDSTEDHINTKFILEPDVNDPLSLYDKIKAEKISDEEEVVKKRGRKKNQDILHCDFCSKEFHHRWQLNRHRLWHSNEKPHKCTFCDKSFRITFQLTEHMRNHTGEKPYICDLCGKSFGQKSAFNTHRQSHSGKIFGCSMCTARFSRKDSMHQHEKVHRGENIRKYICTECGQAFTQNGNLTAHMKLHSNDKPHVCVLCDKKFRQAEHLKVHIRIHTGERPFSCTECGKSFTKATILKEHMGVHAVGDSFKCHICGKGFKTMILRKRHTKWHNRTKEYLCKICDKGFLCRSHLLRHMKSHSHIEISSNCNQSDDLV